MLPHQSVWFCPARKLEDWSLFGLVGRGKMVYEALGCVLWVETRMADCVGAFESREGSMCIIQCTLFGRVVVGCSAASGVRHPKARLPRLHIQELLTSIH